MNKQKLDELTAHMTAAQNEVYDSVVARKGLEYANVVIRAASAIAVLQAAGGAFDGHPQIDTIEKAVNYAIECVLALGAAEAAKLEDIHVAIPDTIGRLKQLTEEFQGDVLSFVQQAVKRVPVGDGNINMLGDGE